MLGVAERRVGYFYFRDELGLDEATLGRLLAHHGAVSSQRRDTPPRRASLRRHLNLDESELAKLSACSPRCWGTTRRSCGGRSSGSGRRATARTSASSARPASCPPPATSARRVLAPAITQLRASTRPGH